MAEPDIDLYADAESDFVDDDNDDSSGKNDTFDEAIATPSRFRTSSTENKSVSLPVPAAPVSSKRFQLLIGNLTWYTSLSCLGWTEPRKCLAETGQEF